MWSQILKNGASGASETALSLSYGQHPYRHEPPLCRQGQCQNHRLYAQRGAVTLRFCHDTHTGQKPIKRGTAFPKRENLTQGAI